MTKEWYETMQKTGFHLLLNVSEEAEMFSEEYFERLYRMKENEYLQLQEEVSKVKFEDIFPEEFNFVPLSGESLEPAELEEAKRHYFEIREQARLNYLNRPAFDPEQEKVKFREKLEFKIQHLEKMLPQEILQKVADIRVLALDYASDEVKKALTEYSESNRKAIEATQKAYWEEYKKIFKDEEPSFISNFKFHDCKVVSCLQKGEDTVITLDNTGGFTNIKEIILKNCIIQKLDAPLEGAWWLYDEIYKTDEGYEIHVLLEKKELIDFIVTVTDVEYE